MVGTTLHSQSIVSLSGHADIYPPSEGLQELIVCLPLDPAARVAAQNVSTTFVVDEDCDTERHWSQPPRPPKHLTHREQHAQNLLNTRVAEMVKF